MLTGFSFNINQVFPFIIFLFVTFKRKECAKSRGSSAIVSLLLFCGPKIFFRGYFFDQRFFSRGYFLGSEFFLGCILWVQVCFVVISKFSLMDNFVIFSS